MNARAALKKHGFVHLPAPKLSGTLRASFKEFIRSIQKLPVDTYATNTVRERRYHEFVVLPWLRIAKPYPTIRENGQSFVEYMQTTYANPQYKGIGRRFAAFSPAQLKNRWLLHTIWNSLDIMPDEVRKRTRPLLAGMHIIRLVATSGKPGYSSPGTLHQDDEPFFTITLLDRSPHITGGGNVIAKPEHAGKMPVDVSRKDILAEFDLRQPGESYAVLDNMVSHHVDHIEVPRGAPRGIRTILAIEFIPLVPQLSADSNDT
jgi:hypothetical protein